MNTKNDLALIKSEIYGEVKPSFLVGVLLTALLTLTWFAGVYAVYLAAAAIKGLENI